MQWERIINKMRVVKRTRRYKLEGETLIISNSSIVAAFPLTIDLELLLRL